MQPFRLVFGSSTDRENQVEHLALLHSFRLPFRLVCGSITDRENQGKVTGTSIIDRDNQASFSLNHKLLGPLNCGQNWKSWERRGENLNH